MLRAPIDGLSYDPVTRAPDFLELVPDLVCGLLHHAKRLQFLREGTLELAGTVLYHSAAIVSEIRQTVAVENIVGLGAEYGHDGRSRRRAKVECCEMDERQILEQRGLVVFGENDIG